MQCKRTAHHIYFLTRTIDCCNHCARHLNDCNNHSDCHFHPASPADLVHMSACRLQKSHRHFKILYLPLPTVLAWSQYYAESTISSVPQSIALPGAKHCKALQSIAKHCKVLKSIAKHCTTWRCHYKFPACHVIVIITVTIRVTIKCHVSNLCHNP